MISIKREKLAANMHELDLLLHDYFERTIAQQGQPKLDMDWSSLGKLETSGHVVLMAARQEDKLVGFALYFLHMHTHHRGVLFALCDILAVNPDHRGQGVATELVLRAERLLRSMGVEYIIHNYRCIYDVEPLFPKL